MARILAVDDSASTLLFLEAALAASGHEVLGARRSGEIAALEGEAPALVLLDLHIPGWSHEEIFQELRARWATEIPVVVHSSFPSSRIRDTVERLGAAGGVAKGLGPEELEEALEPYLGPGSST